MKEINYINMILGAVLLVGGIKSIPQQDEPQDMIQAFGAGVSIVIGVLFIIGWVKFKNE